MKNYSYPGTGREVLSDCILMYSSSRRICIEEGLFVMVSNQKEA